VRTLHGTSPMTAAAGGRNDPRRLCMPTELNFYQHTFLEYCQSSQIPPRSFPKGNR